MKLQPQLLHDTHLYIIPPEAMEVFDKYGIVELVPDTQSIYRFCSIPVKADWENMPEVYGAILSMVASNG